MTATPQAVARSDNSILVVSPLISLPSEVSPVSGSLGKRAVTAVTKMHIALVPKGKIPGIIHCQFVIERV